MIGLDVLARRTPHAARRATHETPGHVVGNRWKESDTQTTNWLSLYLLLNLMLRSQGYPDYGVTLKSESVRRSIIISSYPCSPYSVPNNRNGICRPSLELGKVRVDQTQWRNINCYRVQSERVQVLVLPSNLINTQWAMALNSLKLSQPGQRNQDTSS